MKELEVKILEINKKEVIKKLENLGAKKILDSNVNAIHFDFDDYSLSKQDKILRLRRKGDITELTFKRKISKKKAKIVEELEVKVDDFGSMKKVLERLGLKKIKQYTKHRISYNLNDVHFELDTYPGIPTFLEIEAPDIKKVKESVEKLGYSMKDAKSWNGWDVLKYYRKLS